MIIFGLKISLNLNEEKWDNFFKYKQVQGFYWLISISYFIVLSLILLLGLIWFRWINFNQPILTALLVTAIMTIMGLMKIKKVKSRGCKIKFVNS